MTHSIPYRRILSKMGYYAYQSGLIYNHLHQEGGWDGHLSCCRRFINRALEYYRPDKVTVLGSGWLLDLPLAEMLENTSLVYLVDIVHPPEVVKQAGNLEKVVLIEQDITGGLIEEVWNKTGKFSLFRKLNSLASITIPEFTLDFDPGFIISLNILTQLESQLLNFIKKRSSVSEDEILPFRKGIQEKHVDFLRNHKSVLITDYAEVVIKKSGEVLTNPTLFAELPQGTFKEEWTWDFDLKGNENYNSKSIIKVVSIAL
jgi:hypothetical protein